jgi:fumarylacetoacetate (FAA) hydrolase
VVRLVDLIPDAPGLSGSDGSPLPIGYFDGHVNNLVYLRTWIERLEQAGTARGHDETQVRFAPPVLHPASFRDFYAFERHVATARGRRGLGVPTEWYEAPVFYFSNPAMFLTDGDLLPMPRGGTWLDYELEVAAVLVGEAVDPSPSEAEALIGGFCLLNDFSLRDAQRTEMAVGLGPAKGKDFATGLGPWLVTPDELEDRRAGKGYDLAMRAAVSGRPLSAGNWKEIHYSFAEMIARAGMNVRLRPGDIIGSGTVGSGCILELGPEKTGGWLTPGDAVEIEVERLGRQSIRIAESRKAAKP